LAIEPIVSEAIHIGSTALRSLDAIHLATAGGIAAEPDVLITY
jgi:hypothetical protein